MKELLRLLIPPKVGDVSNEALDEASRPRGKNMLELLGFAGFSFMDAMVGHSEISGMRYRRKVSLYFGTNRRGKPTVTTRVVVPATTFELTAKDANLERLGLPSGVPDVIRQLGPLDKGVRIEGTSTGINIERTRSPKDAASQKGNIQWLNDMRLAESLADVFSPS